MKPSPIHKSKRRDQGPAGMVARLLARLGGADQQPGPLPPPGSRSGRGASSLEPFLSEARSTRPGPLE